MAVKVGDEVKQDDEKGYPEARKSLVKELCARAAPVMSMAVKVFDKVKQDDEKGYPEDEEIRVFVKSALSTDTILSVSVPRKSLVKELCARAESAVSDRCLDKLIYKDRILQPSETFDSEDFADPLELQAVFGPRRLNASLTCRESGDNFSSSCSIKVVPGSRTQFDEKCRYEHFQRTSEEECSEVALQKLKICSRALEKDPEVADRVRALIRNSQTGEGGILLAEAYGGYHCPYSGSSSSCRNYLLFVADHVVTIESDSWQK